MTKNEVQLATPNGGSFPTVSGEKRQPCTTCGGCASIVVESTVKNCPTCSGTGYATETTFGGRILK